MSLLERAERIADTVRCARSWVPAHRHNCVRSALDVYWEGKGHLWTYAARRKRELPRSVGAVGKTSDLVYEHVVPVSVVAASLLSLADRDLTAEAVDGLLARIFNVAYITKEEDRRLRELGFKEEMPNDWDYRTGDPWRRYDEAGIVMATREYLVSLRRC